MLVLPCQRASAQRGDLGRWPRAWDQVLRVLADHRRAKIRERHGGDEADGVDHPGALGCATPLGFGEVVLGWLASEVCGCCERVPGRGVGGGAEVAVGDA